MVLAAEKINNGFPWYRTFDSLNHAVVIIDRKARIVVFNRLAERIFNCSSFEAIGRPVKEIIPKTDLPKVIETGQPQFGRKFKHKDKVYVCNRMPILEEGSVIGAICMAQDITEMESIAEELQAIKELKGTLETILDLAYEGMVVVNREGRITMLNQAFATLLGVTPEETIGKPIDQVVPNLRLPVVLETGKGEIGDIERIGDRDAVTMEVPIVKDGQVVGAVAKIMFRDVEELNALAQRVNALCAELDYYKGEVERYRDSKYSLDKIIGNSGAIRKLKETVKKVAQTNSTVLIMGETGTGKELFAHALHRESSRRHGPFIKVNCAAIPENLLESELFGYREGAFTGARKGGQIGKFELADGGTIFLDEIGDMPLSLQAKLLRVLQDKEIERLGDAKPRKVNVRIIAATHQDLKERIGRGEFREDLFYRLNVVSLNIPPLRERKEDLRLLVNHFVEKYNCEFGMRVTGISSDAYRLLLNYHWPGNVRELENVIERCFNVVEGSTILPEHLPMYLQQFGRSRRLVKKKCTLKSLLDQAEEGAIREALEATKGNKIQAAGLLGISRASLYQKIRKYGLDRLY
ncbi:sigma-54 interaction domain-containing protein [Calderihabitans maritimus]|uniref:Uncharacterized protein n=1 Tax=Calderihabitans maritimus TaxID=1246530 RepID=A0A1Z5HT27_9FIRM|nr:sigma-54-dependent Fis family transcriptional regulator [Calderihabitans maritimus]GAW92682.1 hypothetical protein KKC1_18320 [Calderihabitans maritimus]